MAFMQSADLKVSVNCCDGCKRKVLKALISIKGVLRVEIHPTQPKVTVIGDVDVGVLIKKLSKVGKCARVLDEKAQMPQGEDDVMSKKEKEKEKELGTEKKNESKNSKNKEDKGGPSIHEAIATAIPQMNLCPIVVPQAKVYYPAEPPIVVPIPYYAMTVHPTPVTYYVQDYHCYETPIYRPPPPPPPPPPQSEAMTAFGDYFDEDNTVGCRIM